MKDFLRKIDLFASLGDSGLEKISARLKRHTFAFDQKIIQESEPGSRCHMIISGSVRVSAEITDSTEVFAVLNAGDHFGEISLIDGQAASASVIAEEPTETVSLSREDIMDLFEDDPKLVATILHTMLQAFCRRLREADQTLAFTRLMVREKGA
jgi:CRP/FNR family transcriptional regulator/CRP/FNR family cyclic AMP-dependent transcriptional regulator